MNNQPVTRSSLLIRIRDTDNHQAWQAFIGIYTPLIYSFCRHHGLQDADAADVAQEVMKAVVNAIRRFEYDQHRGGFRNWLLTVTRSKLNNFLAATQRRPQPTGDSTVIALIDSHADTDEGARWDEDYRRRLFEWAAQRVQAEVRPATWQTFWQTAMEDRPAEAVAAANGLSVGAVYVARSRVTTRLRELIASVADEPLDFAPMRE